MGVDNGFAIFNFRLIGCIALDGIFLNGVFYFGYLDNLAGFICLHLELRQILELHRIGVVTVVQHGFGHRSNDFNFSSVRHKMNAVRILCGARPEAIVVVVILPSLSNFNV